VSVEFANDSASAVPADDLIALAVHALERLHIAPEAELSVVCVDPPDIAVLHEEWLDEPGPTDVMSFPMDELRPGEADGPPVIGMLGDVVLCPEVAAQQAATAGHSVDHELRILLAHGILHLLGYDHAEPEEEAEMFALQRELVATYEARAAGHGDD
jgi:probable rRNA maturation factor